MLGILQYQDILSAVECLGLVFALEGHFFLMFQRFYNILVVEPAENAIFVVEMAGFLSASCWYHLEDDSFVLGCIAIDI